MFGLETVCSTKPVSMFFLFLLCPRLFVSPPFLTRSFLVRSRFMCLFFVRFCYMSSMQREGGGRKDVIMEREGGGRKGEREKREIYRESMLPTIHSYYICLLYSHYIFL